MKKSIRRCSFLLALALILQIFAMIPFTTVARAADAAEDYQITPELSDGITVSQSELDALTVQGTASGEKFTFAENKTLTFTAVLGSGWSYNATYSNFFPSDKTNATVTKNADNTVTFTYNAKSGKTIDLSDLENVILTPRLRSCLP